MANIEKQRLRHQALDRRTGQPEKDRVSSLIHEQLHRIPGIAERQNWMIYVSVRTEVRTWQLIESRLVNGQPVFVPYCRGQQLSIFHLKDATHLQRGSFGLLEPAPQFRKQAELHADITEMDVIIVPGVAFDRHTCHRIGYGKGYFDRFLAAAPASVLKVGVAFECQLFESIPTDEHDVPVDVVVTEQSLIVPTR
ncbi:MAG TPA: 5-formyltetrahydrofolate cyclo-ligase [Pirellulaceae bacterium]|mgnify:CR=1 FL=1|nr:5-formyltetrahydrofolate cyclo-ligase [Pirellulaceae bacterium]HMO93617.1 5-formyltetrahydrofolate cyclo-ligase [Pirellulaceae bacterium]HMP70489.1 5-formyltetrahydrofolate cyclo-ligase [Pirellulaceae bacterium]